MTALFEKPKEALFCGVAGGMDGRFRSAIRKRHLVVAIALLSSCATPESLRALDDANKSLKEYEDAVVVTTVDPLELYGAPTTESDAIAENRWLIAEPACVAELVKKGSEMLHGNERLTFTPKSAASALVSTYEKCFERHRLKVQMKVLMNNSEITLAQYFEGFIEAGSLLSQQKIQVAQEKDRAVGMLLLFAGAVAGSANSYTNPSLVNVSPYRKRDGTYVRPHVKTSPNSTCSDNLRGCR